MRLPAIIQRRWAQKILIRGMGGSTWNQWRMFFTGRSGKFHARKAFRQNWPA